MLAQLFWLVARSESVGAGIGTHLGGEVGEEFDSVQSEIGFCC